MTSITLRSAKGSGLTNNEIDANFSNLNTDKAELVSPSFTTPTLGAASATTLNKITITTPATGATLTITDGKTLTALKTMSFTAADDTGVYTLPTGTKTLVATDVTTLSSLVSVGTITTGTWTATDIAVADGGTGRSTGTTAYALIATGTTATGAQQTLAAGATTELLVGGGASALPVWTTATGSGSPVRATSPTLVTPTLGVATATSVQGIVGNVTPAAGTFTALTSTTSTTIASEAVALTANNLPTVRPTLNLDFANSKAVDPRITFTRASTATRINDKGLIETVASGAPRIDYDPVTLACKGLLIEEARTNLLTYSEQFDNAAWTKTRSSISANATTAPDGTVTADKLVEDATASNSHYSYQGVTLTAVAHTYSVYLKAAERTWAKVVLTTGSSGAYFNLSAGTVGTVDGGYTAAITPVGNGWFRCSITVTTTVATWYAQINCATADATASYTGDGTSGLYIWGAQLEAGAFATSYVPTTSAQVTRAADAASMTGANFSSWYRQDEGTFGVSSVVRSDSSASIFPRMLETSDGTTSNCFSIYSRTIDDTYRFSATVASANVDSQIASVTYGSSKVIAAAYSASNSAASISGASVVTNASTVIPAVNNMTIGAQIGGAQVLNGHISRIVYYPQRLANATLQALSTP